MQMEAYADATGDFKKVTELCAKKIKTNERIQASAYYHLGYIEQLAGKPMEAKQYFKEATMVIQELLANTLQAQAE